MSPLVQPRPLRPSPFELPPRSDVLPHFGYHLYKRTSTQDSRGDIWIRVEDRHGRWELSGRCQITKLKSCFFRLPVPNQPPRLRSILRDEPIPLSQFQFRQGSSPSARATVARRTTLHEERDEHDLRSNRRLDTHPMYHYIPAFEGRCSLGLVFDIRNNWSSTWSLADLHGPVSQDTTVGLDCSEKVELVDLNAIVAPRVFGIFCFAKSGLPFDAVVALKYWR